MTLKKTAPMFEIFSPIDGAIHATRDYASFDKIESVLARASCAQIAWASRSLASRIDILNRCVEAVIADTALFAKEITEQMGRPIAQTPGELRGFAERARYMLHIAPIALEDIVPEQKVGFHRFLRREALGTVLIIAPWNYPLLTVVNTLIPALVAGNAVILKHAQQTSLIAEHLVECFKRAGLPEGVFDCLHLTHDSCRSLMGSSQIQFVAFTGSVRGGHDITRAVSERFIQVGLELGGKDPAYVRRDAVMEHAVTELVDGAFFNSGQSCCGIERIYVDATMYDRFVEQFVALTERYLLGDPRLSTTNLGPVVNTDAANLIRAQIEEAISTGARAQIDEHSFLKRCEANAPMLPWRSSYFVPQVLTQVHHGMRVMTDETFGPVVGIMAVKNDDEAIKLMNDSAYGLTASLWTQDEACAIALGAQLQTGTVFMNRCDYLDPALAWTGVKDTGKGISLSRLGYEQLTRVKSYHLKTAKT